MNKVLGIDYGRKKIGLAIAESDSGLAEPYKVIRFKSEEEALEKISRVSRGSRVSRAVVGVSEGKTGEEARSFGKKLQEKLNIPVEFQDETLTSKEAQRLAIKAGIKRKKRRKLEDAYAAALILQAHLDSK